MNNDILKELGTNFIEYAVAVNTDRAIPNATDGLKPVAKRILYCAFDEGFKSDKPHVKCANIVGRTMADWHPHGDSSIYGALTRLSQNWIMRYPLIDFHGANGNIDGDGPAASRYTEARLAKISEEGMLQGIKKDKVDFIDNYSETKKEPIELPAIFPNLLCNPNSGIGVAIACNWAPHNLKEVAQAIYDYIDGKEPMLPGPDFPTGGVIINKNDIPAIMRTGHGSVKIRGKYEVDKNNIVFTEIPYGTGTEALMNQIGEACDAGKIIGVSDIRNESNKKGYRLVIECDKNASIATIINKLFAETNLQTTFSYNQVALVNKTPTELNLKQCIEIYIDYNSKCIVREVTYDANKISERIHILLGLIKALEDIDNIITLIKTSENSSNAKQKLIQKGFSDKQAQAILDMKLAKLAKLEKLELEKELEELKEKLIKLQEIASNPLPELRRQLEKIEKTFGDERKTTLEQIEVLPKEEEEVKFVEPEKCVVVMTESGLIKRIPATSFRTQNRNTKGVKTQDDITSAVIRTNTIDQLMIFTNKGKMYRLLVDKIPIGTNVSQGTNVRALVEMENGEEPQVIYSIYRQTDAKYVLFTTKMGLLKKTTLDEYLKTKKKTGIDAINIKEGDQLVNVNLIKDEQLMIITSSGMAIRIDSAEIGASGRKTSGLKGITLNKNDYVVATLPIRNMNDQLAIFSQNGQGKKINLSEFLLQKRAGKGIICYKPNPSTGSVITATLVSNEDKILIVGNKTSICIPATEIPLANRGALGNILIKNNQIVSISKV